MWSLFSRSHPWLHPEDWNLTLGHSAGFEGDENARRHRLPRHPGHRQWRQWIWREQAVGELCSEILLKAQQGASLEALSALQDGPWLVRLLARNLSGFCKVVNVYNIFFIDILKLSSILAHIQIGRGRILSWNCPLWSPRLGPNLQTGSMVRTEFSWGCTSLKIISHQFLLLFNIGLCLLWCIYPAEAIEQVEECDHHVDEDDQREEGVCDGGHRTDCVWKRFSTELTIRWKHFCEKKRVNFNTCRPKQLSPPGPIETTFFRIAVENYLHSVDILVTLTLGFLEGHWLSRRLWWSSLSQSSLGMNSFYRQTALCWFTFRSVL